MELDNSLMGAKELYEVALKATSPIEINGKFIEKGETIALFDKILLANFNEVKKIAEATGGYGNRSRVIWENVKELDLSFSQGVFSKIQLALLDNARIVTASGVSIGVPKREKIESDESGVLTFTFKPMIDRPMFIYDDMGLKVKKGELVENKYIPDNKKPYTYYMVDYYYEYSNGGTAINFGQPLTNRYFRLEGKTRLKDDKTGKDVTALIEIPKLKLMSNLSISLGKKAIPVVPRFKAVGYPIGSKGQEFTMQMTILNDDIDSDIQ